jgi:glycosyltransferase involved in cell wall biosynthesis
MSLRILFVYQFLSLGGVEVVLQTRLQELIRRGMDARALFLKSFGGEKLFLDLPHQVEVRTSEIEIAEFLRDFNPDWIISLDTPTILPIASQVVPQAHIAYEVHSTYPMSLSPLRYADLLAQVTGILVPSRSQQEMVEDILIRPLPICIVPNALPDIFLEPGESLLPHGRPAVAWVGRLDPLKNWRFFVDLVHLVREKVDAEFWLIGGENSPYNEKASLQEAITSKGLEDCFNWRPAVDHTEMPGLYRAVGQSGGCLVSTSWTESFGMTVLEAMASYCPVVAPDIIGLRDLVRHRETGLLYPPGNQQAASEQIVDLLLHTDIRHTVSENAQNQARTFTPAAVVDGLLKILDEWSTSIPLSEAGEREQVILGSPENIIKSLRIQLIETALTLKEEIRINRELQLQLLEDEKRITDLQGVATENRQSPRAKTGSKDWALLSELRRVRYWLAPPGSQRERFLRWGKTRLGMGRKY